MPNCEIYWYNIYLEKLQYPKRGGYINEDKHITYQAKVQSYTSNIIKYLLQHLKTLPNLNNIKPTYKNTTPSKIEIFL